MASKYWLGKAIPVAQVSTVQITAVDGTPADNDFEITIGGITVAVPGNTNVNTTASDLQVALAASTHPYFAEVTWTVATDTVTGTGPANGFPFIATSSVSGIGAGTIGAVATPTAAVSPNHWSVAANWSDGVVPANTDLVRLEDSSVPILFGLDQNTVTLAELAIDQTYTGFVGLNPTAFTTTDQQEDATADEYRDVYLKIGLDALKIGELLAVGSPIGSGRLNVNNVKAGSSETEIINTKTSPKDANRQSVNLLFANAGADLYVRSAPGGVGVANLIPFETSTMGDVAITDRTSRSRVFTSEGVTLGTWTQSGGDSVMGAAADVTTVTVRGGDLRIEGHFEITGTLELTGGTVVDNHTDATQAVDDANLKGGTLDLTGTAVPRTYNNVNLFPGAELRADTWITITSLVQPAGAYTLSVTD